MDSNGLRVKRILIVFALIGLVFSITTVKATPTQSVSILWTAINTGDLEEYPVAGNYTAPYTVRITPLFTWNATTADAAFQLHFINSNGTNPFYLMQFVDTGVVACSYNGSLVDVMDFTMETEITIKVDTDGYTINNGTGVQIEFFADFAFQIDAVSAKGLMDYILTAGTLIVEFNDGGDFGIDIITDMIPLVVTIAVLGAVLKAFQRFKL